MAVAPTVLAGAINSTDATSFNTASVAVASHQNELFTVAVMSSTAAATPNIPTFTVQRGLTLTQVATNVVAADFCRITLFRSCTAVGGTGLFTIDFAGQTQNVCAWDVVSWTGTNATAANNGSDGVGVSASTGSGSNGTTISTTLAALQTGSASYGAAGIQVTGGTLSVGSGYTSLTSVSTTLPTTSFRTEWQLPGSTTVDASWSTNTHPRIIIGAEILLVGAGRQVGAIPI